MSNKEPSLIVGIGDLHGQLSAFEGIIEKLNSLYSIFNNEKIKEDVQIVFCGDYIDRGENSKTLLEKIMNFQKQNTNVEALNGNHELIALGALDSIKEIDAEISSQETEGQSHGLRRKLYRALTLHGRNGGGKLLENFVEIDSTKSSKGLYLMLNTLSRNGEIGKWLRERPAGIIHSIAGRKILFIHGGVPISVQDKTDLENYFKAYSDHMKTKTCTFIKGSREKFIENPLVSSQSVFWVRDMPLRSQQSVQSQLSKLSIDYAVFGHTPEEQIKMYHDCIFDIDVGMSSAYGGNDPAAIIFKQDGIFAVYQSKPEPQKLRTI